MRIKREHREGSFTATGVIVYAPAGGIINDVIFLDCSVQYVVRGHVEELIYTNRFNREKKKKNTYGDTGHQMNFSISCILLNTFNEYRANFNALFLDFLV